MLKNKRGDMTPYNMSRKPAKQNPLLMPLIWGGSYLMTRPFHLKIEKRNLTGLKPPYLVLSTHQGFSDYYIAPLAMFPHRAAYVSDLEGFAAFGDGLYRGLGCIPKRRYVSDISVVRNMRHALANRQSVVVFPESRHSNVGITANLPHNLGKLAKIMGVPLVILRVNGSYLANPFWDEEHTRKVPLRASMECIFTAEEIQKRSSEEIQLQIERHLTYDEYRYQQENGILITGGKRARGLHKALYRCKSCGVKYHMESARTTLRCQKCGAQWELSQDGWLVNADGKIHIPSWYAWERDMALEEIEPMIFQVSVEALPNHKGFVPLGQGSLQLDFDRFTLMVAGRTLEFPHKIRESVQTEYNYRSRGMCIVLSTWDCSYYIYSDDIRFQPTEIQFMGEYFYSVARGIFPPSARGLSAADSPCL